jgi:hypothetical protein
VRSKNVNLRTLLPDLVSRPPRVTGPFGSQRPEQPGSKCCNSVPLGSSCSPHEGVGASEAPVLWLPLVVICTVPLPPIRARRTAQAVSTLNTYVLDYTKSSPESCLACAGKAFLFRKIELSCSFGHCLVAMEMHVPVTVLCN